jgi:hypothetical protein
LPSSAFKILIGLAQAVGRCIPVWILFFYAHALSFYVVNAVTLASRNNLLEGIATLYREAQRELRHLSTQPGSGPIAMELARHDKLIASFLEVSDYRARLFGFVATYGTVRTLLVTVVTIGVALWSVLRGIGVVITLESFCPL